MALTQITTGSIADDAVTTDKLANAINTARDANTAKTTNATHSGEVTGATALTIADNVVDEANLKVSNSPTNGYFLSAQSGNTGGLTWAQVSTDLVADTSPQLGGDLDLNGSIISVGDGGRDANQEHIRFGNDGDLRIWHDGSNSYIEDSGTGYLIIESNQLQIKNADADEKMIVADANGSVELYHNNSKKFETTSSGVEVFGQLQMDDANSHIKLPDNARIDIGSDADLKLYYNATANTNEFTSPLSTNFRGKNLYFYTNHNSSSESAIMAYANAAVELYYDNGKKLETRSDGVSIFNELSVGTSDIQSASVASFVGGAYNQVNIADGSNSGWGLLLAQQQGTNSSSLYTYSTNSSTNKPCSVVNVQNDALHFGTNNTARFRIEHDGHVLPSANNSYDLGSSGYRWRNIYTNDLNLSNEGGTNDVDGTWGSYTIQEGAEDLFLVNRRNGKKYKFNLTEVS